MANPFDQFDQKPAANPFDQFDAQQPGLGSRISKAFGLAAQGINDVVAETAGLPGEMAKAGVPILPNDILATGAKKLGFNIPIGSPTGEDIKGIFKKVALDQRLEPQGAMERFAYGTGRGTGGVLTTLGGATAAPQALARALTAAPGTQIAAGAIGGGVGEATENPWIGLATALGVGTGMEGAKAAGRYAMYPQARNIPQEQQRLMRAAADEGIPLSTGQQTGSTPVKIMEGALEKLPFSGRMAETDVMKQRQAFTAAAMRRAGVESESAAPDVLAATRKSIGNTRGDIIGRTNVRLDEDFVKGLDDLTATVQSKLPTDQRRIFHSYVNDLRKVVSDAGPGGGYNTYGAELPGATYDITRRNLRTQSESLMNSDVFSARALKGIRNLLDDAMARSVSPKDAAAWQAANRQYANLKTIEQAMKGAGEDTARGLIPPAALKTAAIKSAGGNYSVGGGDLNDLARLGQFLRPYPTSGTAERTMYQAALTGAPVLAGGLDLGAIGLTLGAPPAAYKLLESNMMRRALSGQKPDPARIQELLADVITQRMLAEQRPARGGR